jgi:hypothetical protein
MQAKRAPGTLLGYAIHEDVTVTRAVTEAVHNEPQAFASWVQLTATGGREAPTGADDSARGPLAPAPPAVTDETRTACRNALFCRDPRDLPLARAGRESVVELEAALLCERDEPP